MCFIIGEISREKIDIDKFIRMRDTLVHGSHENLFILKKSQLAEDGVLNKNHINHLITSSFPNISQLWILIILEMWHKKWKLNS